LQLHQTCQRKMLM